MSKTVIIADDSKTARLVTKRCMEIAGYRDAVFLEACHGGEALELIQNQPIDLLVTDLNMPQMDGVSLMKRIKSSPKLNALPILVVSSLTNPAKIAELEQLGAFAVLSKPLTPADMATVLKRLSDKTVDQEP